MKDLELSKVRKTKKFRKKKFVFVGYKKLKKQDYRLTFIFTFDKVKLDLAKIKSFHFNNCYFEKIGALEKHILTNNTKSGIKKFILLNPHPHIICIKIC